MSTYTGTITTTGKSEAIRLEKALFKSHPEFRQKSKVHAHVIAPGTMLVSVVGEAPVETQADPVMAAFLSFLSADISRTPERVRPLAETRIKKARELTKGTKVRDDVAFPDDVTL
ncbi:MAG: type II toxin-antitoxin system PrlF family antitoxin [Xanthobacteraceae bacterium]|jgi:antitoxin PrlF